VGDDGKPDTPDQGIGGKSKAWKEEDMALQGGESGIVTNKKLSTQRAAKPGGKKGEIYSVLQSVTRKSLI